MNDTEYSIAEEKHHIARKRIRTVYADRLKVENAKDSTRFPGRKKEHPVPLDLRRVKKLSDLPEE